MNCHVAMLTRKLLFFNMCTNEFNSHNVLSHCLQANSSLHHLLHCVICYVAFPKMSLIHTMFYHIVCKQIAPYITCFTVLFVMLHSLKWFLPSMSSEVGL